MNKEEILKKAKQHEANAARHDKHSYLAGWHEGAAAVCYSILKTMMDWDEYQVFIQG